MRHQEHCSAIVNPVLLRLALIVGLMLVGSGNAGEGADAGPSLDWWQIKKELQTTLEREKTDLASLAARRADRQPQTVQEALLKVCVLLRAGMHRETIPALNELKALCPAPGPLLAGQIYREAADEAQAWDVAQAVAETFAEEFDGNGSGPLTDGLLKQFLDSGWSIERIDRWLASRPPGPRNFWIKQRLLFNRRYGNEVPLTQALSDRVKANPQDVVGVIEFLDILYAVGPVPLRENELSWLVELCRPDRATEAADIAVGMKTIHSGQEAVSFYRRALDIPLTDEETQRLGRAYSVQLPPDQIRAMFAVHVREQLAECLVELKRNDEAQAAMVEAADLRKRHELGSNALFADRVQETTDRRTIDRE